MSTYGYSYYFLTQCRKLIRVTSLCGNYGMSYHASYLFFPNYKVYYSYSHYSTSWILDMSWNIYCSMTIQCCFWSYSPTERKNIPMNLRNNKEYRKYKFLYFWNISDLIYLLDYCEEKISKVPSCDISHHSLSRIGICY